MTSKGDDWLKGYAAGLAAAWRIGRSDSEIEYALQADGLTLQHLIDAKAEPFDLRVIARCISNPANRGGRGAGEKR